MQSLLLVSWMAINPIIGDASWNDGRPEDASEVERVRAHLLYAEAVLRDAPGSEERAAILDALHAYAIAGKFPQHERVFARRTPRFVDSDGTLCAVGHLLASTEGRKAAEKFGAAHEYQRILDMDDPGLEAWARAHGFTMRELAIIQPTYGSPYFHRESVGRRPGISIEGGLAVPIILGGVGMSDGNHLDVQPVGAAFDGGVGIELGRGVAVLLSGRVGAHEVRGQDALISGQLGVTARWTIEASCEWLAPQIGISAGLMLASADSSDVGATGYGSVLAGARFRFSPQIALDAALAIEGAFAGTAFEAPIAWLTPTLMLSIGDGDAWMHSS